MRILDEKDQELQPEDLNMNIGYLVVEEIVKEHHEAQEEVKEVYHFYPETVYFEDGTSKTFDTDAENDPHVSENEGGESFSYTFLDGEEEKEIRGWDLLKIVDVEYTPAKAAYDEMEEIERYKLYTDEQLATIQAEKEKALKETDFLENGPNKLETVEATVEDMAMVMAEMIGV